MEFAKFKKTIKDKALSLILLFAISLPLAGCKDKADLESIETYSHQDAEISDMKVRISQLEEVIKGNFVKKEIKGSFKTIKSITFRMGSKDDRLRIYWKDGSKTDLPCTKEQTIWACG